jgi:hypothetical protein
MGIEIIISMDWEGTSLHPRNLSRINEFKNFWDIPMVHFLNPAYYTKKEVKTKNERNWIDQQVKSVLQSDDEVALHLHTPKHLVQAAGVGQRLSPCFSQQGDLNQGEMNGQEVMLLTYPKADVKALINFSIDLLEKRGFKNINSFRAGGWMADERVWEALIECGLNIESSATNAKYLKGSSWEGDNLERYIQLLWENIDEGTKPFYLETFSGYIYEIPNNLGAIDYWNQEKIGSILKNIKAERLKQSDLCLVINSHQETAAEHLDKLDYF